MSNSAALPAIVAKGLTKTYTLYDRPLDRMKQFLWRGRRSFGRGFTALADVSFEVQRGEVLGVVGRNGAGKSTLLQIVCGTLQPSSGELAVQGRVAALLELGAGFNPEFTGRENVFLSALLLGACEAEVRSRFEAIVEFAGLAAFIDQPVKTYSSGMFVRLAFAVATAFDPDILVIDEALSVGDGAFARKSFERILALRDQGATILFCSHSTYHIEALCSRALWLEQGRVRMLDAAQRVTAAYNEFLTALENRQTQTGHGLAPGPAPARASGTARILAVEGECEGVRGQRLAAVSRKSSVAITVRFASDPQLPCPCVALGLETAAGVPVSSALSLQAPGSVARGADGRGFARVVFPELPLLKGSYHFSVYVACEQGLHVYDSAVRCLTLEVSQSDILQGVVALPHRWERACA